MPQGLYNRSNLFAIKQGKEDRFHCTVEPSPGRIRCSIWSLESKKKLEIVFGRQIGAKIWEGDERRRFQFLESGDEPLQ